MGSPSAEPYATPAGVYEFQTPDGLEPESSTFAPDAERYGVTARRM